MTVWLVGGHFCPLSCVLCRLVRLPQQARQMPPTRFPCRRPGPCKSPEAASAAGGRRSCASCQRRPQAVQARLHLGDHARVDDAPRDQVPAAGRVEAAESADSGSRRSRRMPGVSVRKTSFSALSGGNGGGGGVGVDVEPAARPRPGPATESPAPRRRRQKSVDQAGIHPRHLADPAQVDRLALGPGERAVRRTGTGARR